MLTFLAVVFLMFSGATWAYLVNRYVKARRSRLSLARVQAASVPPLPASGSEAPVSELPAEGRASRYIM